ncbi:MAG: bifunctional (p)ppGpp synthetase/guanosine-3',5'-bis(diphosphate) 3'-pyrophosphohydrolase [Bacilli bacterium]|nr:bifunctional (p)ppGpp synthetase/guanosine-3',5'-bis(diphosphate) 3'-pyrophosphohydrolase [Bacilli bacterium]
MEYKHTIEDVILRAKVYLKNENNINLIKKAYSLAKEKHEGQFRKSMDPYIQHPIEVAYMLAEFQASPQTIAAGLLHDVLEDTDETKESLEKAFGTDVVSIVEGVTKISRLKYMTLEKALAKSHQKILLAMAKDIRVILVKLVDRVHNMRTLEYQPADKQQKIARETLDLYAPLAHRIGMYRIKAELEDNSLKYLDPDTYSTISNKIKEQRSVREDDINKMSDLITTLLDKNSIQGYQIKGRIKNIYSVCKKMKQKQLDLTEIYDLMALRVLVPSVESCYHVLGLVHGEWSPIPKRFKDYIATPKPNLYQSLHTTIVGIKGKIYEIQIRTYEMDQIAEFGVAAHWAYKEDNKNYSPEKEQLEVSSKLKWYKELLAYAEISESEDFDPLEDIKEDIFSANVYVFTPKGDALDFPQGATPLDFAYRIHTEVGNKTVGAIVNGKIVPLTYKLKTGDIVEIKTNKSFNGPSKSWLKVVKTSHAKHKISSILNKQRREAFIASGKDIFEKVAKEEKFSISKIDDKIVNQFFSKYNVSNLDDFYHEIGKEKLSPKGAINTILGIKDKYTDELLIESYNLKSSRKTSKVSNSLGIIVEGLDKAKIKLASCCLPVYGDIIVGYVTKNSGIVCHRMECHNTNFDSNERLIDVFWDDEAEPRQYDSNLTIYSYNRNNIIGDIINTINITSSIYIKTIKSTSKNKGSDILTSIKLTTPNVDALNKVIANLQKISDIYEIKRNIK